MNLYDVINKNYTENDEQVYVVKFSSKIHPIFKAHFPSNSLLPAFKHIDIAGELLNKTIIEIKKAKFINPILPDDEIIFFIKDKGNIFTVKTLKNNNKCSEFVFEGK